MNITHELMAQVFQHAANLHTEMARLQQEAATVAQENARLSRHVHETEQQLAGYNGQAGASRDDADDASQTRHAAVVRRQAL